MILPVTTPNGSYNIVLERGVLQKAGDCLKLDRRALVVTDRGVPACYAQTVASQCMEAHIVTVAQGEESKSMQTFTHLLRCMAEQGFTRHDCVIAVGGGVVGDLSGFAASCYMRGIDFYNIPTTFLSQVDSSIGGKVAIDLDGIKNIVGAFYQPKGVLIDPDVLSTLDSRQLHAGLAESIKMAATSDSALFTLLEESTDFDSDCDRIIEGSLRIKRDVVQKDPCEQGLRRILNFGHTLGHAIESHAKGNLFHGECVAIGMLPMCSPAIRPCLRAVLEKYSLPTSYSASPDALLSYLKSDKKAQKNQIVTVQVNAIGSHVMQGMTCAEILKAWEANK